MAAPATVNPIPDSPNKKRAASLYQSVKSPSSDQDFWNLVQQFLPIVKGAVARMRIYFPEHIDSQDIYSIGLTGLIQAAQNFDNKKPNAFPSYAKIRVRGALLDELRRLDTLTRSNRSSTKKLQSKVNQLEQSLGHTPSNEEICSHLNLSPLQYQQFLQSKNPIFTPLDASLSSDDSSLPIHELVSDPTEQSPLDLTENQDLIDNLKLCIADLEPTSQKILSLYYLENLRLAEIAVIFKLTESRICQLHSKALSQLRKLLTEKISK